MLKLAFELKDFSVTHALSSSVALEHFRAHDPHVIIFDVQGMRTAELEKAEEFVIEIEDDVRPTFVLTPHIPDWKTFPMLHANHVLKKPYNLTTLIHLVTTVAEETK